MTEPAESLALSRTELSYLGDLLEAEYARTLPRRLLLSPLRLVAYLLPIVLAAFLVQQMLSAAADESRLQLAGWAHRAIDDFGPRLNELLVVLVSLLLLFLALNVTSLVRAFRQWRLWCLTSELRLADRQFQRPAPSYRRLLLLAPSLALAAVYFAARLGSETRVTRWWEEAVTLAIFVVLPVLLYVADRLLRHLRLRLSYLEEVGRVKSELRRATVGAGGDALLLPMPLARRLARIERALVFRRRAESAREPEGFAVQMAPEVVATLRRLEPDKEEAVELALLGLTQTPRPVAARPAPAGGQLLLTVSGAGCALRYQVDAEERCIRLLAIESAEEGDS